MLSGKILKLVSIVGFLSLATGILFAWDSPATGYESSIYWSTPIVFWLCLVFSLALGISIVIFCIGNRQNNSGWFVGYVLIFAVCLTILTLNIIRGYTLYNAAGDLGSHLGSIKEILVSGHTEPQNYYPVAHGYVAQLSLILNLDYIWLQKLMVPFFTLICVPFVYLFAWTITPEKGARVLISIAGMYSLASQTPYFTPNALGNLLIPIFIYILFKIFTENQISWNILLTVLILLIAPMHPVPTVAAAVIILGVWLSIKVLYTTNGFASARSSSFKYPLILAFSFLILVWAVSWISSFGIFAGTIRSLQYLLIHGGSTQLDTLSQNASLASQKGYSLIQYFFKAYGVQALFLIASGIATIIIIKRIVAKTETTRLIAIIGPLLLLGITLIVTLLTNMPFGGLRLLFYTGLISSFFTGFIFSLFIEWSVTKTRLLKILVSFGTGVLILMIFILGFATIYPSPYSYSPSYHNPLAEIEGTNSFIHNKNTKLLQSSWNFDIYRFAAFQLSPEEIKYRKDVSAGTTLPIPNHLGYDKSPELGTSYGRNTYLILTEITRRVYVDTYPEMAELRLTQGDFAQLENDTSVDKLYDNRGFDVWYIHSQKVQP